MKTEEFNAIIDDLNSCAERLTVGWRALHPEARKAMTPVYAKHIRNLAAQLSLSAPVYVSAPKSSA